MKIYLWVVLITLLLSCITKICRLSGWMSLKAKESHEALDLFIDTAMASWTVYFLLNI